MDDGDIRPALEMLPQSVLRSIIDERDISFTSRYTEELIDRLLADTWTEEEFDALIQRVADVERERNPKSRYVVPIEAINPDLEGRDGVERARRVLELNTAQFSDDILVNDGFEILSFDDDEIDGIHWTRSINYTLTPQREIRREPTVYNTAFTLDATRNLLFIDSTLPPKARSLVSQLGENGIESAQIEYGTLPNSVANARIQEFIDALEGELERQNPQQSVDEGYDRSLVEVDLVKILMDDLNLKDVKIGGRTNIIDHPEVEDFIDDYDSMIVRLEGKFELSGRWYEFKAGQTDGMGQVSVRKVGSVEERPDLVDGAFDFLYGLFEAHFMDV